MSVRIDPDTLGFLAGDLSRLFRAEFERRIAGAGLGVTPGEGRALLHVARAGAVRQAHLAERLGVEAMTLSGYVDRLEARGLVVRLPDPTDRRAKLVQLTAAADPVLARIAAIMKAMRADAMGEIGDEEWSMLLDRLKTVRANLMARRAEATVRAESDAA